ncbi:MAG: CAAD domain-containing protein [Cyanobacteria bacterium P01_A01_bin.135]
MEPDIKQDTPETPASGTTGAQYGSDAAAFTPADSAPSPGETKTASTSGAAGGETKEQWQKIGEQTSTFLSELPSYVSEFFSQYRRPIVTLGLILGIILAFKVALAVLDAINDIPLLAPIFEMIGIGYVIWFIYRYLLKASNRAELSQDFSALKAQVLGQTDRLLDRFSTEDRPGS